MPTEDQSLMQVYQEVDGRRDDEGPVPPEVSIGDISSQDRHQEDGPNQVGDIVCSIHSPLMQPIRQVQHQVP